MTKLRIQAGSANPAPSIDPAPSQHGMNIMKFCKAHNARIESMRDSIVPVEITAYGDRSFDFVLKTPPASEMTRKAADVQKDPGTPNTVKVTNLTWDQVVRIVGERTKDLNANDIEATKRTIAGTVRSMGVTVG